ncbi:hypothetical protein KIN20_016763 [Parelaphostrongylus tenuis]|uniref:PDZ domain-containing protein n=1 Tax=Parelaphostrongylus tenuis TaxID=148309 RepID=A0AAD5N1Q4_PARTN|nr:hypothetical protein KIN20_016763 [Parelaphostrongylus tenuis]
MTTDNGFNSIARRAFYIGDALLSVNDTPCTSTKQASKLLLDALKTKGIKDLMAVQARVIVERPVNPAAIAIVKSVLYMKTANVMDPKMPDDVVAICKAELLRLNHEASVPKKHLLKESTESSEEVNAKDDQSQCAEQPQRRIVTIFENSIEMSIGMEMFNPALLQVGNAFMRRPVLKVNLYQFVV